MTATKRSPRPPSTAPAAQGSGWAPPHPTVTDLMRQRRMLLGIRERAEGTPPRTDHPPRLHDNQGSGRDDDNP